MSVCKLQKHEFHEYIDTWMIKVEQDKVESCKEQKALMPFVRKELSQPGVTIDSDLIYEAVEIIEKYFPFKLLDFQKFFLSFVVGVFKDGFLLFDEYLMLGGRGIGKNGLISAISFYLMSDRHDIKDYDINIIATSEDQAKTSFEEVYNVLEDNPVLDNFFSKTLTLIQNKRNRSALKYMTSNSRTKDGGRPGTIIFDEVHQYENYENINVHTDGLGKVENPRTFYITTDGEVRDSVLDDLKEKSDYILKGEWEHNGFFPFIFKIDTIEEAEDEVMWEKAIPRLPYCRTLQRTLKKAYLDGRRNLDRKESFLTKRMNIPYVAEDRVAATWEDIIATKEHEWPDLTGCECIGGVDYADLRDFVSVGLLFKQNGVRYFKQHTFIHQKSLNMTDYNINIEEAVKKGWATIIPDRPETPTIPVSALTDWFVKQSSKYSIQKVMADRFRLAAIREGFDEIGLDVEPIGNGYVTHNKIEPLITKLFTERQVAFEDDKLMRWYVNNTGVDVDKKENKSYVKIEPKRRKTDGFFCFLHCMVADEELLDEGPPVFFEMIT